MRIYQLNPDSTTEKTAVMYALSRGYTFKLTDVDGTATVTNAQGEAYNIDNWQCDCADSMNRDGGSYTLGNTERHVCKHVVWLSQLYPCPNCKGYMILRNEAWKVYQCCTPACYTMTPFQLVKANRQQAYRQHEQEADVLKTHQPEDVDAILAQAEAASKAIFSDSHTPETVETKFHSNHGVSIRTTSGGYEVRCMGFLDSTHRTEAEAIERAEQLEVLESSFSQQRNFA